MAFRGDDNKHDAGKPMWDLLPYREVGQIVDVLTYGASKYAPYNWLEMRDPQARCFAAIMRHLTAWKGKELLDNESGLHHLAHAGCCLLFLMYFVNEETGCHVSDAPAGSQLPATGGTVGTGM